jgi:hypothetical protein
MKQFPGRIPVAQLGGVPDDHQGRQDEAEDSEVIAPLWVVFREAVTDDGRRHMSEIGGNYSRE